MIITGDCLEIMPTLEADSIDSIITDPPYGLSFMGKNWDHGVPGVAYWIEALRVAKPGAFLLAFGGTRTFHRLAVAIEDAGWELRDTIGWLYGSGFPKSLNIGKAVDKLQGNEREFVSGTAKPIEYSGKFDQRSSIERTKTKGSSEWEGWGTALKPAWEPIVVARKPIEKTVAENVLKYGTGGINIDGCRVETDEPITNHSRGKKSAISKGKYGDSSEQETHQTNGQKLGRFPANLIHDGSDEVLGLFPESKSGWRNSDKPNAVEGACNSFGANNITGNHFNDSGSAARFFYCAKSSKQDRDEGCEGMSDRLKLTQMRSANGTGEKNFEGGFTDTIRKNHHPTVKPTALMRYLCKLVTQPNGLILDPFCGSGSTGKAAIMEGFNFIGIDKEPEYVEIARRRIEAEKKQIKMF